MENVPSKVASKAYVYRKLRELPFTGALSKKKFNSLREETLQLINSNKTFAPGKKLTKLTPQQVSVVQNFIDTVKTRIQDGTFTPAKYTDKRGCRFFSIAPIYSVQTKSIQIDAQAFWRLMKQCGIPNYPKGKKTESDLTDFYYHLFNFKQNTCNIVWNRDIMAAHNIFDIFLFAARNNNQRLDVSIRQGTSNDQPSV
ncbi:hypothetical protein BCV72DRAFT_64318 [Rhizopus microsporus var. microsporus]|uniref:Uncharacterized protein n=1 Tax=Rhizopus microsporus var. microsporus TaxID=86635 RepID=A0A1X0RC23_RHIZD|nr:hypothetical protein BCV72DRAFT_64318 [Rhizopus microsporus var. microsporus]